MAKMATLYVENIFAADFNDKLLNCTTACLGDQSLAGTGTQCCTYIMYRPTEIWPFSVHGAIQREEDAVNL